LSLNNWRQKLWGRVK